jgi:hypothetical protein
MAGPKGPAIVLYGKSGIGAAALFAFGTFFHSRGLGCQGAARAQIIAGNWWAGEPDPAVAPFVQECRQWAQAVAAGDRERLACAYGYAVRQLKYADTDKELSAAIACTAANALLATF